METNYERNKKYLESKHQTLIDAGYVYLGSDSKSEWGDDIIVTQKYLSPDKKSIHKFTYSGYALGWDEFKFYSEGSVNIEEFSV